MSCQLLLHGGKIAGVIGLQAQSPMGLQLSCCHGQKVDLNQATKPMPPFGPGIREGDVQGVQKAIRNKGIKRFLTPPAPEEDIAKSKSCDFPVGPAHTIRKPLDSGKEDFRVGYRTLREKLALGSTEITFDTVIVGRGPDQLFPGTLKIAVRHHPARQRDLPSPGLQFGPASHGWFKRRLFPGACGSRQSAYPRQRHD